MILNTLHDYVADVSPSLIITATVGLLMFMGLLTFISSVSEDVLPGVPELKGFPVLGALPSHLINGIPDTINRLIAIGSEGISYANVVSNVLVSVHEPALVREVLGYPDEIASREGDTSGGRMSWSPFLTLRRMCGQLSLFNYAGPGTRQQRSVYIREFNSNKSNMEKFDSVRRIAKDHADMLVADVDDIRYSADNFAIALWGETLYGNPHQNADDKVLNLSNTIMDLAGDPWPAIWYYIQLLFHIVSPGQATGSEAKLRSRVVEVVSHNIAKLEEYEAMNPKAPLKTIRNLSVNTGGGQTGRLSKVASEFANLNLFGGHHSIGLNVTWCLIELDKHPEQLSRLMGEIDAADTTDFAVVNNKMPYLDAVVTETNRIHPTVHATLRVINRETRLASASDVGKRDVILKPGMMVFISYLHLHTSEKFWGPDARQFVPERFLEPGRYNKEKMPLMSFGYGPRNCVGYKFAIMAVKVYLITLLKTYKIDLKDHNHEGKLGTLLEPSKPVAVRATRRT
ncbi:putative cytochrome P450 [Apodospora peruviana]|uniref:Cytochrome P450 n=1 Tax=Apodospora peruviana TaxID=516989 RepID=A0AAE0HZ70_9PEZI|nr:putative cytochrome P450 [Apodospora peruviana]